MGLIRAQQLKQNKNTLTPLLSWGVDICKSNLDFRVQYCVEAKGLVKISATCIVEVMGSSLS